MTRRQAICAKNAYILVLIDHPKSIAVGLNRAVFLAEVEVTSADKITRHGIKWGEK